MIRRLKLNTTPTRARLQSLASGPIPVQVDQEQAYRTAGKFGAGLLKDVSAITRGEALGHDFWIDAQFLQQVATALAVASDGSKCRFTHPGLSADGLAKGLGLAIGGRVVGEQVLTDLNFYASAHTSPDGNLAGYVMDRAAEDPKHFGTSIVFISDEQAEIDFMLANGGKWETIDDGWGSTYDIIVDFKSPDPLNVGNLPHCRLFEFLAVDVVDDPAANPNGLFHRDLTTISAAESFLDYTLGYSAKKPTGMAFDIDPERARLFVQRYAAQRGLSLPTQKGESMPKILKKGRLADGNADPAMDPNTPVDPNKTSSQDPNEQPIKGAEGDPVDGSVTCPECGAVFIPDNSEPEPITDAPQTPSEHAAAHQKYVAAFGAENGSKWFLGKVKFSDAQKHHFSVQLAAKDQQIASLKAQLKSAQDRLAAIAGSGEKPLASSPPASGTEGGSKGAGGFSSLFKVAGAG